MLRCILILCALVALPSCASKPQMVRTTTTTAAPGTFGLSRSATTVTESPYESPFKTRMGDAGVQLFSR